MTDTISRQAAIDAIEDITWYHQNKNKDMVSGANSSEHQAWYKADDIYKALENLPSAQPKKIYIAQFEVKFTEEELQRRIDMSIEKLPKEREE